MRLAFFADSQVDERSRHVEHDRVCDFIVTDAEERDCSVLLHGGDVFERRSTVIERDSVWAWLDAAVVNGMAVGICGGNHEAPGEVAELDDPAADVHAFEAPSVRTFGSSSDAVVVAFLPWPRRSCVVAWFERVHGRPPSPEESSRSASELLRDVLRGLGQQLAMVGNMPRILLAHVQLSGARTDPDQPAMVGCDLELSIEDLMLAGADVVLLGHIHLPQHFTGHRADGVEVPVIYAGSPRRTAYARGELTEKGYVVVEFDGRTPRWERIPTPATPMILLDATWRGPGVGFVAGAGSESFFGDGALVNPPGLVGGEIRFRWTAPVDAREAARAGAELMAAAFRAAGALDVKLDEVVESTVRARAPEVATAPTLREKLEATWAAMGDGAPEMARRPGLLARAEMVAAEGSAS